MRLKIAPVLAVALVAAPSAYAGLVTYDFTVKGVGGPLDGVVSSGLFAFDDTGYTGLYTGPITAFSFTWAGVSYDETDLDYASLSGPANALATVSFGNDCYATGGGGFACSAIGAGAWYMGSGFTVWPPPPEGPVRAFSYGAGVDEGYAGDLFARDSFSWSLRIIGVPEPGTLALLSLGLLGLGLTARRRPH